MDYTLITGATGVIGKHFAKECAKCGNNLYLTGRSLQKLNDLKNQLGAEYAVDIQVFPCDLSKGEEREKLFEHAKNFSFSMLINVAGADIQMPFEEYSQKQITFQIRANFEGAVSFTHFVLKHKSLNLQIINISSVSGIYPMPYFAIYSATKRALTNFSVALREECKGKGVSVCAVLPGAVYTRNDVIENIKTQGIWGKLAAKHPQFIVEKSLKAVKKNKAVYIPGFCNKLMNTFTKIIPMQLKLKYIAKRWKKTKKNAFGD